MPRDLPALTAMVLCLALAAGSHGVARDLRRDAAPAPVSLAPMPDMLRIASLGHGTAAASLLWMHTVTRFTAAMYDVDDPDAPAWIADAVRAAGDLDPEWTLPWVYGSMMLDRLDAIGTREELLHAAVEAHPEEPWFPFVLGMSRYRHHDDLVGALGWLERAAAVPGADRAYERALRSMRSRVEARQGTAPKFSGSERSFPGGSDAEDVRSDTGNAGGKPQTSRQGEDPAHEGVAPVAP